MYQGSSRLQRREKKPHPLLPPAMGEEEEERRKPLAVPRRNGNVQNARINALKTVYPSPHNAVCSLEENSFKMAFVQNKSKRSNGTPMKKLLDEEAMHAMEPKRRSPSLIARLMGLDTLPSAQPVDKQQNHDYCNKGALLTGDWRNFESPKQQLLNQEYMVDKRQSLGGFNKAASSMRDWRNFEPPKQQPSWKSTNEDQEFKDVFEVTEASWIRNHKKEPIKKVIWNDEQRDNDLDRRKKKFRDAKLLSSDRAHRCSKDFSNTLDILDSNKDLLWDFLQDRNSLFSKHLQDVSEPLCSNPCQITLLKSSKSTKCGSNDVSSTSQIKLEKRMEKQTEVRSNSFKKPATSQCSCSHSKFSSLKHAVGSEGHRHPADIVLLKPSLVKAEKLSEDNSFGAEVFDFESRKHKKFVMSGIQELHKEGRQKLKLSDDLKYLSHKVNKGSREIERKMTRRMRQPTHTCSKKSVLESNAFIQYQSSCIFPDDAKFHSNELFGKLSDSSNECSDSFIPCSSRLSLSSEGRKLFSDRCKMTSQYNELKDVPVGSTTLDEMLALSGVEAPKAMMHSLDAKKVPKGKHVSDEVLETWDWPFDLSSKHSWKPMRSRNLPRSKPVTRPTLSDSSELNIKVQAGSSDFCMPKDVLNMGTNDFPDAKFTRSGRLMLESSLYRSKNDRPSHSVMEEKEQYEQGIHVSSEQLRSTHVRHILEDNTLAALPTDEPFSDNKHIAKSASVAVSKEEPCPCHKDRVKQFVLQVPPQDKQLSGHFQADIMSQETSSHNDQVDLSPNQLEVTESDTSLSFKECEQPSPVSVLEPPPAEEENSTSGCFERLSADLQELRMQLKLLKLESEHACTDELDMDISSDEDCLQESQSGKPVLQTFKNEDDRDFSYLLDILIDSGIHCADWDCLSSLFNLLGFPVGQPIFDRLEKKYNALPWSRSERKLLFDIVSCTLSDLATPCIDLHSSTKLKRSLHALDRGLVEGLWQMVVKKRNELGDYEEILDQRWLGLEVDSECIGKQLERMLSDSLLEELVADLITGC